MEERIKTITHELNRRTCFFCSFSFFSFPYITKQTQHAITRTQSETRMWTDLRCLFLLDLVTKSQVTCSSETWEYQIKSGGNRWIETRRGSSELLQDSKLGLVMETNMDFSDRQVGQQGIQTLIRLGRFITSGGQNGTVIIGEGTPYGNDVSFSFTHRDRWGVIAAMQLQEVGGLVDLMLGQASPTTWC